MPKISEKIAFHLPTGGFPSPSLAPPLIVMQEKGSSGLVRHAMDVNSIFFIVV